MRRRPSRLNRVLAALLLVVALGSGLPGCLLNRVYGFKRQFCDYQRNFELVVDDSIRLKLRRPLLRDGDLVWLLGAEPTRRSMVDGRLQMLYLVEKDLADADPRYALPLRLLFEPRDGRFLWAEGVIERNVGSMITPGLIDETVAHTCSSKTNLFDKTVSVDLSGLDRASIPRRSAIEDALGPPTEVLAQRLVEYRYRLRTLQPGVERSRARVWYGPDGESVSRVRFDYLRYRFDADFVAGRGLISIDL